MTVTKRRVKAESAEGAATEPGIKYTCDVCGADITHTVRIKCAAKECPEVDLCPSCFSKGEEKDAHKAWHDYKIVETHAKPIFTEDWGADEELLLITGLQQFGLGNWQDVAEYVGTRYKEECEKHYLDVYINDRKSGKPFMPRMKAKLDISQEEFMVRKRARIEKMRQPAPIPLTAIEQTKASAPTNHEVAGYMPGRLEFEHEVDNDAEIVIKDMEFGLVYAYGGDEQPEAPTKADKSAVVMDKPAVSSKALPSSTKPAEGEKGKPDSDDVEMKDISENSNTEEVKGTQEAVKAEAEESDGEHDPILQPGMHVEDEEDLELKLAALEIYYEKLQHRQEVKDFIFDRALMDYKRMQKAEKNKSKEEKDLVQRYKVFAKAQTAEDFEVLLNGLHYEQLLRKRIAELQDYRRLGILTASDASRYEKMRVERASRLRRHHRVCHLTCGLPFRRKQVAGYRTANSSIPREPSTLAERSLRRSQNGRIDDPTGNGNEARTDSYTYRDVPRSAPLQLSQADALALLTPEEQELCSSLKMLPRPYLVIKETFIVENARRGGMLKRKDVKKMFRIDPAITTRIYDFLIANEMLFRDEPKSSKPKIAKEDADSSTIESQVPATSETPASVS
ncbi:Transcriptional adapter ada2 [Naganishia albida]|nr:Transcriptional adapter ada2 [Naganishia albida]